MLCIKQLTKNATMSLDHRNRKIPRTRRSEDQVEEISGDELDSGPKFSVPDSAKPPKPSLNGFDNIEEGHVDKQQPSSLSSKLLLCCCGESCWKITEDFDKEVFPHPFRGVDFLATICSIVFFFYDIISDIILAQKYYLMERWISFGFTTGFIVLPLLVLNIKSVRWYYFDYTREKEKGRGHHTKSSVWFLRVFFTLPLMMGIVVRHVEFLYHGWKSRSVSLKKGERKHHYRQMLHEDTDAGMMRMLEAFLESAPQLVLQMYIILTETYDESLLMSIVRPIAMVGSWIGVSWSLVSYHKALRASHNEEEKGLSIFGTIFYYIWRSFEVGPRMVVLALFAAQFQYYMLIACVVHWIAMSIWVAMQKPKFYEKTSDKVVFNFVIGYVLIFCFQNVQEGHTRYRALLYYFVMYTENIAMLVSWLYFTSHKSDWYYLTAMIVVPSCMVIHICVHLFYYKCCHPKSDSIVSCLNPMKDYNCYQSVCHQSKKSKSRRDTAETVYQPSV